MLGLNNAPRIQRIILVSKIIRVCNSILKHTINVAKTKYYENLFNQYRSNIKMTCKTISEIICKSNSKRKELVKIIVDSQVVSDKREICEKYWS